MPVKKEIPSESILYAKRFLYFIRTKISFFDQYDQPLKVHKSKEVLVDLFYSLMMQKLIIFVELYKPLR